MEKKESKEINILKSETNKECKKLFIEDKQNIENYFSKTEYDTNLKYTSTDENKKYIVIEPLELDANKENNKFLHNINIINKNRFFKNKIDSKIKNISKTEKEYQTYKLNKAIDTINLKLDSSINNKVKRIRINRNNKNLLNSDNENNSIISNKFNDKNNLSIKKEQNSIDTSFINRKICIYSNRNRSKLRVSLNNNTDFKKNINLNIYHNIKQNKKSVYSSLKIKSKSITPKISYFPSSNIYNKSNKSKIKKRYNSVQAVSPKNESLKVNKKINKSIIGNNKIIKKSFSFKKNQNQNLNDINNNSFINNKNKNFLSSKEQIIEEKINDLNIEAIKFREERDKINKLKIEYEKLQTQLFKDIDVFSKKKEEFEKFRQNEINNINKERKNLLIDNKNIINIKNQNKSLEIEIKKNEETISQLKNQINDLQSIIKSKDNEIKNLQKMINDKNLYKKVTSMNKIKEIKIGNENNNSFGKINKKNSVKIFNNSEKGDIFNSNTYLAKKFDLLKNNKKNISISNNNSILTQKNSSNFFKNIKKYNKENNIEDINKTIVNNSNQIDNNSSYNMKIKSDLDYNTKFNHSKIESIKTMKNTYFLNKDFTIKNYQNKIDIYNKNSINPIQNKLKKNLKNSIKIDFINKKINKKDYKANHSYSKANMDPLKKNNNNHYITEEIKNGPNNDNDDNKLNMTNNNYDFVIPEKYIQIEKNTCNKIIKILNINENNIAIYSNNKKEITYPDGMKQIIYDDNHQIIYYKNGNIKQIFNNGKIVLYDNINKKVETSYENGIKIIKDKNGNIERFLNNNKENINNNTINDSNLNIISNENENNNEVNKKMGREYIYNKYKTFKKNKS